MKNLVKFFTLTVFSGLLISCGSDVVIDEYHEIEEGIWHVDSLASFDFEIEDTTQSYNVVYNVRYDRKYPYYNLYVSYYLEDSLEQPIKSELQNLILFDKKTGEPLGDGMGDLYDREILIYDDHKFETPGTYHFKVKQFMRMEELNGIMSFGLHIKAKEED